MTFNMKYGISHINNFSHENLILQINEKSKEKFIFLFAYILFAP